MIKPIRNSYFHSFTFLSTGTIQGFSLVNSLYSTFPFRQFCFHCHNNIFFYRNHIFLKFAFHTIFLFIHIFLYSYSFNKQSFQLKLQELQFSGFYVQISSYVLLHIFHSSSILSVRYNPGRNLTFFRGCIRTFSPLFGFNAILSFVVIISNFPIP